MCAMLFPMVFFPMLFHSIKLFQCFFLWFFNAFTSFWLGLLDLGVLVGPLLKLIAQFYLLSFIQIFEFIFTFTLKTQKALFIHITLKSIILY